MISPLPRIPFVDSVLAIEQQAKEAGFEAGLFDFSFSREPATSYFNSSIVQCPDGLWLIARRSRHDPKLRVGMNDIVRIRLEGLQPMEILSVGMPRQFSDEHFEDPRAFRFEGHTWISACDFIWSRGAMRWSGAHQVLAKFNDNWQCVGRYDIDFGKNGPELGANTGHEKNWMFFGSEEGLNFVYQSSPHIVVQLNKNMEPAVRFETFANFKWSFGEIRGGAPPVRCGDDYWTFFHSSVPATLNNRPTRRYVAGIYTFSAKPPFGMTGIAKIPLLQGSYRNRWSPDKPAVAFPCGAMREGDDWIITGGSNDLDTFWARMPHALILSHLKVLHASPLTPPLKDAGRGLSRHPAAPSPGRISPAGQQD